MIIISKTYIGTVIVLLSVTAIVGFSLPIAAYSKISFLSNIQSSEENQSGIPAQKTNATNTVLFLIQKSIALDNLGNHSQAIPYFDQALSLDPKNSYALTRKGIALDNLSNYGQAIPYFDKALSIDPKNLSALIGKGTALELQGNSWRT
jgi:tetratricopeptide (TPR) repeat protein